MFWVACARKLKKTREKKIRVAKFDNSDNGASVLIGLFENISNTNCFLNFRASNFLVFTSQNAPIISRIPTLTFFHRLITLAASEHFPSLSGCKCSRSFLYQNGWKFSVSSPRGRRTESRPYPFTLGNFRGFRY